MISWYHDIMDSCCTIKPIALAHPTPKPTLFPKANWLIPEKLIMGSNPGELDSQVRSILDQGVTAFVNLQEKKELKELVPYEPLLQEAGVSVTYLPIKDKSVVGDATIREYVSTVLELMKDNIVYMHCLGGKGRTGTVGAIVVGLWYQIPAKDALKFTRAAFKLRPNKGKRVTKVPQTAAQVAQVHRILDSG